MKRLKLIITSIICTGFLLSCNLFNPIDGSGNLETRDFPVNEEFTVIDVHEICNVSITQGDVFSVSVRADDNLFEYINISMNNGELDISLDNLSNINNFTFEVDVVLPELHNIMVDGVSSCRIDNFSQAHDLAISVSSVSRLKADNCLVTGDIRLILSGTSTALLGGSIVDGDYHVDLEGVSSAKINLTGKIYGSIGGVSSLEYTGGSLDSSFNSGGITCSVDFY